ncbi:MAG: hypothetical protein ABIG44_16085 [Planctomycetota bacterium]
MSEPSDARKIAILIVPFLMFALVFYVMFKKESDREWHSSTIRPSQAARLSDEELAQAITKEWVKKALGPKARLTEMTVKINDPRQPESTDPLGARIAGKIAVAEATKPFELKVKVHVGDKAVKYDVQDWDFD